MPTTPSSYDRRRRRATATVGPAAAGRGGSHDFETDDRGIEDIAGDAPHACATISASSCG